MAATTTAVREQLLKEEIASDFINEPEHTCRHCGLVGQMMVPESNGHYYCLDRVNCWDRWDQQHGLEGFHL